MKNYPVIEIFKSIQGEGAKSGVAANFIRLAGCNLACPWCDTKYSWGYEQAELMESYEIIRKLSPSIPYVVITGGEPLIHNLRDLLLNLHAMHFTVAIETNGSLEIPENVRDLIDWVTVSPKRQSDFVVKPSRPDEIKYIVDDEFTVDDIKDEYRFESGALLFVNPESDRKEMRQKAFDIVMKNADIRMGVQLHKILEVQ